MNAVPDFLDNFAEYTDFTSPGLPQNGRINFIERKSAGGNLGPAYNGFLFPSQAEPGFQSDMLRGNLEESSLTQAYFSPDNITIIQNAIRYKVYERSGKKWLIDPQSTDELKIIMRDIYYRYAKNLPNKITQQITELNYLVIDHVVRNVYSEIKQHLFYLDDISHMPVPLAHPTIVSSAGTRTPKNPVFFELDQPASV
jgi:hypothetical protein